MGVGWNLQQEEGHDKPSDEVDTKGALELGCLAVVGGEDARAGDVERGERQPESTVGCEGCKERERVRQQGIVRHG